LVGITLVGIVAGALGSGLLLGVVIASGKVNDVVRICG
jgi:hypothetical protein